MAGQWGAVAHRRPEPAGVKVGNRKFQGSADKTISAGTPLGSKLLIGEFCHEARPVERLHQIIVRTRFQCLVDHVDIGIGGEIDDPCCCIRKRTFEVADKVKRLAARDMPVQQDYVRHELGAGVESIFRCLSMADNEFDFGQNGACNFPDCL